MVDSEFLAILRCPRCARQNGGALRAEGEAWLVCQEPKCRRKYPIVKGFPVLLTKEIEQGSQVPIEGLSN